MLYKTPHVVHISFNYHMDFLNPPSRFQLLKLLALAVYTWSASGLIKQRSDCMISGAHLFLHNRAAIITLHSPDEVRNLAHHLDPFQSFAFYRLAITRYQRPALHLCKLSAAANEYQQNLPIP
ncbi:hypothetical protein MRY26_16185 [Escherichia coli]|uniref:hypothetical protein n=1 Tax=Escherichia coli TaxID=562 RepID=UPI001FA95DBA|nr:hypothetical protein [Escherichia coli]MCI4858949.1 hypothetical protein [Escherichia coli]